MGTEHDGGEDHQGVRNLNIVVDYMNISLALWKHQLNYLHPVLGGCGDV